MDGDGRREPGFTVPRPVRAALGLVWPPPDEAALQAAAAGRIVLVTGASRGIGAASARRLAAAGAVVLLVARSAGDLDRVRADITAAGGGAHAYPADLTDSAAVAGLLERIQQRHQHVDVIISNAGKSIRRSVADTHDRFHDVVRTANLNYLGPVQLILGLLPAMRARRSGHIVNVSSVSTDIPAPNWAAYTGSKSAFEAWLRCAAPELRSDGIATTSIHFPLVHTDMSAPTSFYRYLPGMSTTEAADAVCRAVADRPRLMSPWWSRIIGAGAAAAQPANDALMSLVYHAEQSERLREAGRTARRLTGRLAGAQRREDR